MYIPKKYGQSKIDLCPFCSKRATIKNKQGLPTCLEHKNQELKDMKCVCGGYLDLREGKWGPYFNCINCGNINFRKVLEINPLKPFSEDKEKKPQKSNAEIKSRKQNINKKEIVVRSDELDFM